MLLNGAILLMQLLGVNPPADAKMVKEAHKQQEKFESFRRMNLPRDFRGGTRDRCDQMIGRYCYWYDAAENMVGIEADEIKEAREKLLRYLDAAAVSSPADAWVAGQRVRYLIEAQRPEVARQVAQTCRAEHWWCAALEGLTLHIMQQYVESDSIFGIALLEMPSAQRCDWLDLRLVVGQRLEKEIKKAGCDERAKLAERLWMLSQPLWAKRGNDLRTEHFARQTMSAIMAKSANTQGLAFSHDSRELLLRYGWPEWYTRHEVTTNGAYTSFSTTVITGHDREPSYSFFPDISSLTALPRLTPESWIVRLPPGRSRYAPKYLRGLSTPAHQLVRFPRGDSMRVAVAYVLDDGELATDDAVKGYVFAFQDGALQPSAPQKGIGPLWTTIPSDTTIVSIEVIGELTQHAARARYTIDPLPRVDKAALSDLLLYDPTGTPDGSDVSLLITKAVTTAQLPAHRPLGVYWELESPPNPGPAWFNLTVEPMKAGLMKRLARRLHLADEPSPVRLRWEGVIQKPLEQQSVTLRLPDNASGKYRVLLTIEPTNGPPITSGRDIDLQR
jgi:hypothetical protein